MGRKPRRRATLRHRIRRNGRAAMPKLARSAPNPHIEVTEGWPEVPAGDRAMNANLVELPVLEENCPTAPSKCEEEFSQISESLQRREELLAASAKASRLLLEAPDVRGVVPDVLRLIGEAAGVDRVNLILSQAGPGGEPLLVVASEWVAEGVDSHLEDPAMCTCDERNFSAVCTELRAGRSVCL